MADTDSRKTEMRNHHWIGMPHTLAKNNVNLWKALPTPEANWSRSTPMMFLTMLAQSSSLFVPLFMVLLSVIEFDLKGLVYIVSLTLCTVLYRFLTNQIVTDQSAASESPTARARKANPACRMFTLPMLQNTNFENQSISTFVLVFTMSYLLSPMVELNKYNYPFLFTLLVLILLDICWKVYSSCTSFLGVLTGMMMGGLLGFLVWMAFRRFPILSSHGSSAYYFDRMNGENTCKVHGNVKYTCDFEDEDEEAYIVG